MRINKWVNYLSKKQYLTISNMDDMDDMVKYLRTLGYKDTKYRSTEGLGRYILQEMKKTGYRDRYVQLMWVSSNCEITITFWREEK